MHTLAVTDFFRNSNYAEAALWGVIAVAILLLGSRWRISGRGRVMMFITLVAFGASDVVEAHTGAWWEPWWLLVWKGVCVVVLLGAVVVFVRARREKEHDADRAPFQDNGG